MLMRNSRLQDQIYTWKSIHYIIRQQKKNDSFDKQNIHCKPWQAKKEQKSLQECQMYPKYLIQILNFIGKMLEIILIQFQDNTMISAIIVIFQFFSFHEWFGKNSSRILTHTTLKKNKQLNVYIVVCKYTAKMSEES